MVAKRSRYRSKNGKICIDVRVRKAKQLFDARDPAPFRDRDLDDDFINYIITSADEFSMSTPLQLLIHIDEPQKNLSVDAIVQAIHSHFEYQVDLQTKQLTRILKTGQIFLVIGLTFFFTSLAVVHALRESFLRDGLIIFGWVAMWKPIELILFDWYPLYYKIRQSRKLGKTEVDVIFNAKSDKVTSV